MPLYKGNKNISAIYKGTTQISAIYKGTILVYSSAFWQSLLYSYLYNDLIPTTINNKNVLDKAKVSKIYANGVIENQQMISTAIPATSTNNGITLTNNGDGSYTMSGTATAMATFVAYSAATLINGHKYLEYFVPRGGSPETYLGGDANGFLDPADHGGTIANTTFSTNTASLAYYLRVMSGATVNFTWKPMLFDLTLMFGAGNEPTAITDKRIQAILNRGYIPYNTGEYKGTNIGLFSSEPYNLFDEQLEGNGIDTETGVNIGSGNNFRSKNFTSVVGGFQYTVELNGTALGTTGYNFYLIEYDANKGFLKTTDGWQITSKTYTLLSNTKFVRFQAWKSGSNWATNVPTDTNICFHRTGTRTGYAPYTEPQTLSFIYQGNGALNAKDTYELTKTSHVFTKNILKSKIKDSVGWSYDSANLTFSAGISKLKYVEDNVIFNAVSNMYLPQSRNYVNSNTSVDKLMRADNSSSYIYIRDLSYTTTSDFLNNRGDTIIYYEQTTPLIISIPRKRLKIVDLSTLNYTYVVSNNRHFFIANLTDAVPATSSTSVFNGYCKWFNNSLFTDTWKNYSMSYYTTNSTQILFCDNDYTNVTDFKTAMQGIYLFYETNAEVSDIADTISIEAGGSITSDSEVLPDVEFSVKCK